MLQLSYKYESGLPKDFGKHVQLSFGLKNTSKRVNEKQRECYGGVIREPGRTLIFKDVLGGSEESAYSPVYTGSCRMASHGCDM